ncbi:hypothetical protein [Lactococcus lactis]|uniref:hypothetical protein n=1 Tax=Lactococcus lactis TaxID=1358 RepID=UPI001258E1C8|nr:hypothetical protein [Lactococcus lactis]TYR25568.1 hypothetical protein FYK05_06820 [Lactococcus lactis subsp. lactis bv. diacetylactis]
MKIISKDLSNLEEGKAIYKQGKVLVNRETGTFLAFIFNRNIGNIGSGISPYSGSNEALEEDWAFVFTENLEKAIRFKDEFEEWLVYRLMPLKNETKANNVYAPLYNKESNPEGSWQFQTIKSIMKKGKSVPSRGKESNNGNLL